MRLDGESGLSYAILRPTVLFGREDILINNIAWALRRFPVFAIFGDGSYRLQPVHVDDLAGIAVAEGMRSANSIINVIGPETFVYRDMVRAIGAAIGRSRMLATCRRAWRIGPARCWDGLCATSLSRARKSRV